MTDVKKLSEEYMDKFKGLTQPDGTEGGPCLIDLYCAHLAGFRAALECSEVRMLCVAIEMAAGKGSKPMILADFDRLLEGAK